MKVKKPISILLVCFVGYGCSGQTTTHRNPPKNIGEAISYLNNDWSAADKLKFKNQPEDKAVTSIHFSIGLWIRNTWIYGDRASDLVKYFHKLGIYAPDDISSIILTSFHRQLNHKPLNITRQIVPYISYWKSISDCEASSDKIALRNYKRFAVGDPITILMVVDTSDKQRNAVLFDCPTEKWRFNPKKDLTIHGVVVEKYFINSITNVFFKVRINKMNYPDTRILMDTVKTGSEVSFTLKQLTIK